MGTGWAAGGSPGGRRRLGEVLVAGKVLTEPQLDETLAVLPRNVALRHGAIPVTLAHDVLTVALADPTNVLALDDIRLATKLASVRTAVATASDVQEAVNRLIDMGVEPFLIISSLTLVVASAWPGCPPRGARSRSRPTPGPWSCSASTPTRSTGPGCARARAAASVPRPVTRVASACSRSSG
jgi:Type II secretion system (T2SS), protein E, N-terminal domain